MPLFSIITLPTGFVGDITANASTLLDDLSPIITLIIGILLAVVVISVIIQAIKH